MAKDLDKQFETLYGVSQFDELDNTISQIAERSSELERFVLLLMADRFKQIGETGVALTKSEINEDLRKIAKKAHETEVLIKADTNRLLEITVSDTYKDAKFYFDYRSMEYLPLDENKPVQELLQEAKTGVAEDKFYHTQAFMVRDPKDRKKLIATPTSEAYNEAINKAAEEVVSGVGDYRTAVRQTVKDMVDNGMKVVEYDTESGKPYAQDAQAAVERNIQDNIRDINQKADDEIGRQIGCDGKEISVHQYSAPDHEPIQGHQFTNEEYEKLQNSEAFEDYKGRKFAAIKRHIGQYNCRHFAHSIILGINKPNYTDEQLQEFIDKNHEGYTDKNGKHRTMYECTQEQRRLERLVRRSKMGQMVAKEAGDIELAREYQADVNHYVQRYKEFSEECGLEMKGERLYVKGYKPIKI